MPGRYKMSFLDSSDEVASATINGASLNATNHDAQIALQDTLHAAVGAITLGQIWQYERVAQSHKLSQVKPTNKAAQRECKCLVTYEDTVLFRRYSIELPTFDLLLLKDGTDEMEIESGAGLAFVNALEAYALSPVTMHPIKVLKVTHIGRRN